MVRIVCSDTHEYQESTARANHCAAFPHQPDAIIRCSTVSDVRRAIELAVAEELPVVPMSFAASRHPYRIGARSQPGGVVIDTSLMSSVSFDKPGVVVVGPGLRLDRLLYAATSRAPRRVVEGVLTVDVPMHPGDCANVRCAGFTLGGGYGIVSRARGLAADHLVEAELVTSEGNFVRVNEEERPDLLWALRGGGLGGFGVVTSMTLDLVPHPLTPLGLYGAWPIDRLGDVLRLLRGVFAEGGPDALALRMMVLGAGGVPRVVLHGTWLGEAGRGSALITSLVRGLGTPLEWLLGPMSSFDVIRLVEERHHQPVLESGVKTVTRNGYMAMSSLDDHFIDAFVHEAQHFGPESWSNAQLWVLGGAIARVPRNATAFVHRNASFLLVAQGQWQDERDRGAEMAWADDFLTHMAPWLNGERYQNLHDSGDDSQVAHYAEALDRLRRLKASVDPLHLFRGGIEEITPAAPAFAGGGTLSDSDPGTLSSHLSRH